LTVLLIRSVSFCRAVSAEFRFVSQVSKGTWSTSRPNVHWC